MQVIDARDLAGWIVEMIEQRRTGVFNATGPAVTMEEMLQACATDRDASLTCVTEQFLLDEGVRPWTDLPFWLPRAKGLMAIDRAKTAAAGLRCRPLPETSADVLRWFREAENGRALRAGLPADRERQLLQRYSNARSRTALL